jgi:hypothetical protein
VGAPSIFQNRVELIRQKIRCDRLNELAFNLIEERLGQDRKVRFTQEDGCMRSIWRFPMTDNTGKCNAAREHEVDFEWRLRKKM